MGNAPFMQLYVGDYLADTRHLSAEQHGAYLLLLMALWSSGGSLPDDPAKLARIACTQPRRWPQVWDGIREFFDIQAGRISNARLSRELAKAHEKSRVRALSGAQGGRAKALKTKDAPLANARSLPKHSSEPESSLETNVSTAPVSSQPGEQPLGQDPAKVMFDAGVRELGRIGMKPDRARRLLGKWAKEHGTEAVIVALGRAQREGAIDPVSFIEGVLRWRAKGGSARAPQIGERTTTRDGRVMEWAGAIDQWVEVRG